VKIRTTSAVTRTDPVPRLNLSEAFGVLDCLVHFPHLVRIDHQHRTCRSSILSLQLRTIGIPKFLALGQVFGIVNDGSHEFASSEVRPEVTSDLHLEVVETLRDSLFRQIEDFLIRVS